MAVRPEFPRMGFIDPAHGYSDLFPCPAVGPSLRVFLGDSIFRHPVEFIGLYPFEMVAEETGLCFLQLIHPQRKGGQLFSL